MTQPPHLPALTILLLLAAAPALAGPTSADLVLEGDRVRLKRPAPDPAIPVAALPADLEDAFWDRVNAARIKFPDVRVSTAMENEKRTYPAAMWTYLNGEKRDDVIRYFEMPDGEHPWTDQVDLYWCFTLKGQARKWFFFQPDLSDDYRARMLGAMKKWTAEDPRPSLELVLSVDSPDPVAREYALELLHKMKVPAATVRQWADAMEPKNPDFAAHARRVIAEPGYDNDPGDDPAAWQAWWARWAAGDWKVYEEYERLANPVPHPVHGTGTGPVGGQWNPEVRGTRADARNTDNLRSMRETTVYLFAEASGNEKVRRLYKDKLRRFTIGLYHVGMGEWDSATYHPHTITPWLTLHDFAEDPEVRLLARATLDWLHTALAIKHRHGRFVGPSKRDYGNATGSRGGTEASGYASFVFGEAPHHDKALADDIHLALSGYRPPLAVMNLALRRMALPVEQRNTKPAYAHWLPGAGDAPQFFETLHIGPSFTLGTCVSAGGGHDVSPMKLAVDTDQGDVRFFTANSGKWYTGLDPADRRGQHGNLLVHLRSAPKPFVFQVPEDAPQVTRDGTWFIDMQTAFLAIRLFGLEPGAPQPIRGKNAKFYRDDTLITATAADGPLHGYALEVGAKADHPTFDAFQQTVLKKSRLDLTDDAATLTATDGRRLRVAAQSTDGLPTVERDGVARDWTAEQAIYDAGDAPDGVWLGWQTGTLTVKAGGATYTCTVSPNGKVTFSETFDD